MSYQASYLQLLKTEDLKERRNKAYERLSCCDLCAHACQADRLNGRAGVCQVDDSALISDYD